MKKLIWILCTAAIYLALVATTQAEHPDSSGLWEIIPGKCYLDGIISPPYKFIDDMDGFEVPLVAMWSPAERDEHSQYRGDAKFGVYNFTIGEGERIKAYTVDVDLNRDDPGLSEKERHNRFIYRCEDGTGRCIATLATVKAAITEQIARDYEIEVEDIMYENDASINFLGVFVKNMTPTGMKSGDKRGQIYLHTEVCGTYEIAMVERRTIY